MEVAFYHQQPIPTNQYPYFKEPQFRSRSNSGCSQEACVGCNATSAIRVHYGAPSCHGCKAFFRRSVYEARNYQCSGNGDCEVANESRNRCRACRFKKCLEGGMNPKHVREERQKDRMAEQTSDQEMMQQIQIQRKISYTPAPESQLTSFLCGLERQMEQLSDEDVRGHDELCEWSRDISLPFGLLNPRLVIKRSPLTWACQRAMNSADLYSQWYRAFVLHADWAMGIPDFRVMPLNDQTQLFKQNFMAFSWITYSYKCYEVGMEEVGIPLGNGAYIPYRDDDQGNMEPRWAISYGTVCKKLIDLIVKPMKELQMTFEEYVLIKAISLFQRDCPLSETAQNTCARMMEKLLEALAVHIENRFPHLTHNQRTMRALKCTLLLPSFNHIGQIEAAMINNLSSVDLCELSGVPMDILNTHRPGTRPI